MIRALLYLFAIGLLIGAANAERGRGRPFMAGGLALIALGAVVSWFGGRL